MFDLDNSDMLNYNLLGRLFQDNRILSRRAEGSGEMMIWATFKEGNRFGALPNKTTSRDCGLGNLDTCL